MLPRRILLIEDEEAHAEAILRSLEDVEGLELRVMSTLHEFRREAEAWGPSLALMDLNLPDGRALELLPDPGDTRTFPIIVMTSFGSEETAVEALKSGAFDYLVKSPETFRSLPRTLERLDREWQQRVEGKRMHRELRESEARNRALLNAIPDLIYMNRREGTFLACHASDPQRFYVPPERFLHRPLQEILPGHVARPFLQAFARALDTGRVQELDYALEVQGETRHFEARVAPSAEDTVITLVRDVTERHRAEEQRRILQAHLQQAQKMESLGALAGGVAHDMNNVLGAILGLASSGLATQPPGSPSHRAFDTISKAAHRGATMVKGLLSFARQSPEEEKDLDVNVLIREEVHLLERTTLARVRLEMDLAENLVPIRGDASAFAHAVMNLCVNAVDALPENGTLTLRTRNLEDRWIEVQVVDTGCGMTPEVLERALDPFFTTKAVGKGTGLGLSMVYSMVKAHHGWMDIQSEPGRGTCVSLRFPGCTTSSAAPLDPMESGAEAPSASLEILVVDDDELIQESLQAVLEVLGHHAIPVLSGEAALAWLEGGASADGVILDMNMPGLGGASTLPRLRALRPDLPVLLSTGRADHQALALVEADPLVTLLSKPFTMGDLKRRLQALGAVRK